MIGGSLVPMVEKLTNGYRWQGFFNFFTRIKEFNDTSEKIQNVNVT
jgi:hypothetical protein